jgi:hypothetical protein
MSSTTLAGSSSSTMSVPIATVVDPSESAPSRIVDYPTETREPADSAGVRSSVCLLGMRVLMLFVAYALS